LDVTSETFEREVIERSAELPIVVDFWAAWCGPCRALGPVLENEVKKQEGKVALVKIDVDTEQTLAAQFGIQSIPTVAVFRDGKPIIGFVGAQPASAIGSFLDDLLAQEAPTETALAS
jgi:putative thioredoxin